MKFLVIGDLHGQKPDIHYSGYDAIIATGDFCTNHSKTFRYMMKAVKHEIVTGKEVAWHDLMGRREAKELIQKSIADGRAVLEKLDNLGVPVYVIPGNWDWKDKETDWKFLQKDYYAEIISGLSNVIDCHNGLVDAGDYQIVGYGLVSGIEKEDVYKEKLRLLNKLFKKAKKPVIFLSHNTPHNTSIDKIVNPKSPRNGQHYGSKVVRAIIEEYKPVVSIGGHMHEHFGKDKIGRTVCVNAGYGKDAQILMELTGSKVKKLEFYRGCK